MHLNTPSAKKSDNSFDIILAGGEIMNLQQKMNQTMVYIEDNLYNHIDFNQLAQILNCSDYEFRRMFSFLTQIPLSDYIRKRRLTVAAIDLRNGNKIIDISQKYGYDSQAAFSRAFRNLHGLTPSKARDKEVVLNSYPPLKFKLVLMEEIDMKNEEQRVIVGGHGDRYGITVDMDQEIIHRTNEQFWNTKGNDVIGCLALPLYGAFISEEKCQLLGDLTNQKVLDICCGTGHSLLYVGEKKASELWGIDISQDQLNKAEVLLSNNNLKANLICSPMEQECGLPLSYFDTVYSVYGIGWTTDLEGTFKRIASYMKKMLHLYLVGLIQSINVFQLNTMH
jgi:AraC-like DNA-binding protein